MQYYPDGGTYLLSLHGDHGKGVGSLPTREEICASEPHGAVHHCSKQLSSKGAAQAIILHCQPCSTTSNGREKYGSGNIVPPIGQNN